MHEAEHSHGFFILLITKRATLSPARQRRRRSREGPRGGGEGGERSTGRSPIERSHIKRMLVSCVVVLSLRWNSFEAHKMEEFASLVVPASGGMRVLDVGGRVIQGGARSIFEARGCNFTSLDIQADKSVDVVSPPGQPFPFADGHFDLVITSSTFEHDPMFSAIAAHPGVRRETQLYEYALRRFERDMSTVPDRAAKVGAIKAAAFACSINASCVSGEPQPGAVSTQLMTQLRPQTAETSGATCDEREPSWRCGHIHIVLVAPWLRPGATPVRYPLTAPAPPPARRVSAPPPAVCCLACLHRRPMVAPPTAACGRWVEAMEICTNHSQRVSSAPTAGRALSTTCTCTPSRRRPPARSPPFARPAAALPPPSTWRWARALTCALACSCCATCP